MTAVEYSCVGCSVTIPGDSPDPQAAPQLDCPECGERMDYRVPPWESSDAIRACGNSEHDLFACELPRGHEGPHKALVGRADEVEW